MTKNRGKKKMDALGVHWKLSIYKLGKASLWCKSTFCHWLSSTFGGIHVEPSTSITVPAVIFFFDMAAWNLEVLLGTWKHGACDIQTLSGMSILCRLDQSANTVRTFSSLCLWC